MTSILFLEKLLHLVRNRTELFSAGEETAKEPADRLERILGEGQNQGENLRNQLRSTQARGLLHVIVDIANRA
jgi:hypothetical protein